MGVTFGLAHWQPTLYREQHIASEWKVRLDAFSASGRVEDSIAAHIGPFLFPWALAFPTGEPILAALTVDLV
jgi:hypothetical protein